MKVKELIEKLKELEKFGFTQNEICCCNKEYNHHYYYNSDLRILGDDYTAINSTDKNYNFPRRLHLDRNRLKTYDILYDLIQAGLVEKV